MMVIEENNMVFLDLYTPLPDYLVVDKSIPMFAKMEDYLNSIQNMCNYMENGCHIMMLEAILI